MAERSGSIESSGANKGSFPRRALRLFGWLVLLVLVVYGASNLWLVSRWGTNVLESKLEKRTGFDWEVGSVSWSPWNGVTISDARVLQSDELREDHGQPMVVVERIRVKPYWNRLLRGGMRPREILVESPQVRVSLEMLEALDMGMDEPEVPQPPTGPVASAQSAPSGQADPAGAPSVAQHAEAGAQKLPSQKPKPVPARPEVKRPPAGLPIRLRVQDASLLVVSAGKDVELLSIERASLDLPVFGEDSSGVIEVPSMKVVGFPEFEGFEQEVVWKRPHLELEEKAVDVGGVKVRFGAQLAMGQSAGGKFPFIFDIFIDPQKVDSVSGFERMAMKVRAAKLAGRFRLIGLSLSPMTWFAEGLVIGEGVSVKEAHGGHHVVFDMMYLPAALRQGKLYWSGARMTGEDLSVLGNGRASLRGGIVSVTRLVASPEMAMEISKGLSGTGIVADRWWHDLDTPDRKVRDLTVSGSLYNPVVDAGTNYTSLPLRQVIGKIFGFVGEEMNEEGKELAPLPGNGIINVKRRENH